MAPPPVRDVLALNRSGCIGTSPISTKRHRRSRICSVYCGSLTGICYFRGNWGATKTPQNSSTPSKAGSPPSADVRNWSLSVTSRYGPGKSRRMLRCSTCKKRFSERKGTPLFDSRLPPERVVAILSHVAEGNGTRKTARLTGSLQDTVTRYFRKAVD